MVFAHSNEFPRAGRVLRLALAVTAVLLGSCTFQRPLFPDAGDTRLIAFRDRTVAALTVALPAAGEVLREANGYAVFDVVGDVLPLDGDKAFGLLTDNRNGATRVMTLLRTGVGAGSNYNSERQVIAFRTAASLERFAARGADGNPEEQPLPGAAVAASSNAAITVYDLTANGVVVHSNWGASRYEPYGTLR